MRLLILLFLAVAVAVADTHTAASCSGANVQTAIDAAANGDTVSIPAGNCTWTTTVTIASKGLIVVGAGVDVTNITDQGASGSALAASGLSATNFLDLSGFTFIKSTAHTNGLVAIEGAMEVSFRVHTVRILHATSGSRGIVTVGAFGLIDHVTFDVTSATGSIQSVAVFGSAEGTDAGFTPWMSALSLGSSNAVYIEDSTFNYGSVDEDCVDAYGGARLVIRHNAFNNAHVGFHGFDSGDRRSAFSWEMHDNVFTNNSATQFRGMTIRGGTGVIYNNTYTGSKAWYDITAMLYRACPPLDQSKWGTCDGTSWELGSTNFATDASRTASVGGGVKFCSTARDTVCTTDSTCTAIGGGTCSTYLDGAGTAGYACRDQPGRTHNQVLSPMYAWNNGTVALGT